LIEEYCFAVLKAREKSFDFHREEVYIGGIHLYIFVMAVNSAGITCSADQLRNGQCSFNAYQAIGIRKDQPDTNVKTFVQDIFLSSTFAIGSVVAIGLMYSWWLIITAKDAAAASKGKNGIKYSFIALILVAISYTAVRLAQYIARG
jgi:hypothetical protein